MLGEYPPGTSVQKPFFLQRNRLIAGLARGLCVAEARRISGTMNTVSAALSAGRVVSSGSHQTRCVRVGGSSAADSTSSAVAPSIRTRKSARERRKVDPSAGNTESST